MRKRKDVLDGSLEADSVEEAAEAALAPAAYDPIYGASIYYCEGRHKPLWRGRLHAACAIISPIPIILQLRLCRNAAAFASCSIALFGTTFLMSMSGLYHCGKWTRRQEELLGNLDYFGIYLQFAFSIAPVFVLLMPTYRYGWTVVSILAAAAATGGWLTFSGREFSRFVLVAIYTVMAGAQLVPLFAPFLGKSIIQEMLPSERWMLLGVTLSYGSGSQIFAHAWPPLCKNAFGFHELWHVLIVLGSAMSYSTNSSIVERIS